MNKQKGLPLEFKLKLKGEFVGYAKHDNGLIYHLLKKSEWAPDPQFMPITIGAEIVNFYIKHDEECQWTGYLDENGGKIYFGDKLSYIPNKINEDKFVVMIDNGDICGKSKSSKIYPFSFRKYMELT